MQLDSSLKRVELHVHLDGSPRPNTIFELAQRKGIKLSFANSVALENALQPKEPYYLGHFLRSFEYILPVFEGDKKEAIARLSEEFVEDCKIRSNLCYVETRFSPHSLAGNRMSADEATTVVLEALTRAAVKHNVQVRLILCILRDKPENAFEVLDLARKYRPHGVVGIDLAGDEGKWMTTKFSDEIVQVFEHAKSEGIHRTVHAGENGPACAVENAVKQLHAERIGHGYSVLNDVHILDFVKQKNIHFELCPTSSLMTGAAKRGSVHPLHHFASAGMNYSINTDDPTITGRWLDQELQFCVDGLSVSADLQEAQINAAQAAFLDVEEDREALVNHVRNRI
ncbi:unnamed protein product [Echinostoma caproni]|uniref:Adenosine deaminase n=1 Tax=Echinostoma caproni TaxID=27848 RepID=A0A183A6W5_9TREM|nr:unnamed protein product [Echinostoma caproni]